VKTDQCPSCGGKKQVVSKLCRSCYSRSNLELVCPSCGGRKNAVSKVCLKCYYSSISPRRIKEPCPQCGRPKLKEAQLCMSCRRNRDDLPVLPGKEPQRESLKSPNWDLITTQFLHQFLGLFLGEGCMRMKLNKIGTINITMTIKLRADDLPALQYIQEHLGGSTGVQNRAGGNGNPEARWSLSKQSDVYDLLIALEPLLLIPMKKAQEFKLALEYIRWRETQSYHGLDRDVCQEYHERLMVLRQYV
jgi:hypothetical protein